MKVMVVRCFLSGIFNLLNAFGRFKVGLIRLILPCGARVEEGGFVVVVPISAMSISLICTWCARGNSTTQGNGWDLAAYGSICRVGTSARGSMCMNGVIDWYKRGGGRYGGTECGSATAKIAIINV